jgi:hypothetical protein
VLVQRQGEALPAEKAFARLPSRCRPLQQVQLASLRALVPEHLARQAAHSVLRSLVRALAQELLIVVATPVAPPNPGWRAQARYPRRAYSGTTASKPLRPGSGEGR